MAANTLLEVRDLSTNFTVETGVVNAVEGVELELTEGETLGIVGESGSGKSVTALSIMQLIDDPGEVATGEVLFKGEDLTEKPENALMSLVPLAVGQGVLGVRGYLGDSGEKRTALGR